MDRIRSFCKIKFDKDSVQEMDILDSFLAVAYYFFYMLLIFLFGLFMYEASIYKHWSKFFNNKEMYKFMFYIPITIISILPIILSVHFRKQKVSTLGIVKNNLFKSILFGIIFSLPFIAPKIITGVVNNHMVASIENLIWKFLYFLICIAFVEEIAFRGFIQSRIRGIIKNKWLSIVLVGVMFGSMHIPFQMLQSNLSFIQFLKKDLVHLIVTVILHIYFVFIYKKTNNIIAPTITHTLINLSSHIFI